MIFDALAVICFLTAIGCFLVGAFNERSTRPAMVPFGLALVTGGIVLLAGPSLA